jgi:hypothetical protein
VLQVLNSGLSSPAQFLYRLSQRGYGFETDAATGRATHVRHLASSETFTWAEALLPGSPPLAERLDTAVQTKQRQQAAGQRQAEAGTWARERTQAEQTLAEVAATERGTTRERLSRLADAAGYPLLPGPAADGSERFQSRKTGAVFREREVLSGGTVAALVAEAGAARAVLRQELAPQVTAILEHTKYPADARLRSVRDYQARMEAQGLQLQASMPGQGIDEVRHQASGEVFNLREVQPGGPTTPPLQEQVRMVLAAERAGKMQAEQQLVEVLARQEFTNWPEFFDRARQQGCLQVMGLDGQTRLLH